MGKPDRSIGQYKLRSRHEARLELYIWGRHSTSFSNFKPPTTSWSRLSSTIFPIFNVVRKGRVVLREISPIARLPSTFQSINRSVDIHLARSRTHDPPHLSPLSSNHPSTIRSTTCDIYWLSFTLLRILNDHLESLTTKGKWFDLVSHRCLQFTPTSRSRFNIPLSDPKLTSTFRTTVYHLPEQKRNQLVFVRKIYTSESWIYLWVFQSPHFSTTIPLYRKPSQSLTRITDMPS